MANPEGRPYSRTPIRKPASSCGCDGCCSGTCGTSDSCQNLPMPPRPETGTPIPRDEKVRQGSKF